VATNLRLVADTADREPCELPPERASDRMPERRLADARRPDEAEDLAGGILLELRDGEVLDDPLLDLVEVVVVLVEDVPVVIEVEIVVRVAALRESREPVEIGADDPVLGRRRGKPPESRKLAVGSLPNRLR
jgi:hypothetical protein